MPQPRRSHVQVQGPHRTRASLWRPPQCWPERSTQPSDTALAGPLRPCGFLPERALPQAAACWTAGQPDSLTAWPALPSTCPGPGASELPAGAREAWLGASLLGATRAQANAQQPKTNCQPRKRTVLHMGHKGWCSHSLNSSEAWLARACPEQLTGPPASPVQRRGRSPDHSSAFSAPFPFYFPEISSHNTNARMAEETWGSAARKPTGCTCWARNTSFPSGLSCDLLSPRCGAGWGCAWAVVGTERHPGWDGWRR